MTKTALRFSLALCASALLTLSSLAQQQQRPRLTVFGGTLDDRGSSRVAFWDNQKNIAAGEYAICYGRPPWNPQIGSQLDAATIGKMWRLGDNFWTTLDTNLSLKISGVEIPIGNYYLAVERSDADSWSLAFIDPDGVRELRLDAYETITRQPRVPVLHRVPIRFRKVESVTERLSVLLSPDPAVQDKATLIISWGDMELTADIVATLPDLD